MTFSKVVVFVYYILISLFLLSISNIVKSETLHVDYRTFYSHLNKLNSTDTNALQFAFGFINIKTKQLCVINSARISTDKKQIPLKVTTENRFTLPTEKALKLANAVVILDLTEKSNICDISVQLETIPKYLKSNYTAKELQTIYQQYTSFFDAIGGFMSFMMPTVDGIVIQFENKAISVTLRNSMRIKQGLLVVNSSEINELDNIELPAVPLRITAKTTE